MEKYLCSNRVVSYQLDCFSTTPVGIGELQLAFEALKKKLFAEGLFDEEYKKPLPGISSVHRNYHFANKVPLQDMISVLTRRFPAIGNYSRAGTKVQGLGAAEEIAEAIHDLNAVKISMLLLLEEAAARWKICGRLMKK